MSHINYAVVSIEDSKICCVRRSTRRSAERLFSKKAVGASVVTLERLGHTNTRLAMSLGCAKYIWGYIGRTSTQKETR